jgi:mannose-6-phosphate isomerase-like protein (cupin superfamily)
MHRLIAALGATLFFVGAEPSAGQTRAAERQTPAEPAYRQLVPGLLARTRFVAPTNGDRRVELWDLLVGPGKRSGPATLPGGAVLEVRGGSGRITVGDKDQELRTGATLAVPDGASFRLVNGRDDLGLSIRATVVAGGRR